MKKFITFIKIGKLNKLYLVIIILFYCSLSVAQEIISYDKLLIRENLYFKKFSNFEFTGIVQTYYENGQLKENGEIINGKKLGLWKEFFQDGQLYISSNWEENLRHGVTKVYFENSGNLQTIERYEKGKLNGLMETFYENGNRSIIQYYENGHAHKREYFDEFGNLKETKIQKFNKPVTWTWSDGTETISPCSDEVNERLKVNCK